MQCVILAGGPGTRLGPLTRDCPKPMLEVGGRPFLEHLISHFGRFGFDRFLILAGYRVDVIDEHFADDPAIEILAEPEPLGTGGALRFAEQRLDPEFLMVNGDSLFDFNVLDLIRSAVSTKPLATLALRIIPDASRYGVVELGEQGRVIAMRERPERDGEGLVNGGIYWMRRDMVASIPPGMVSLERDIFPQLAAAGRIQGRTYDGFFLDIGVPDDFQRAQSLFPLQRPALFFDRDGVLNYDDGHTHRIEDFRWMPGAKESIRRLNDAGWLVFVVTNQAGVARGLYDEAQVQALHRWMNTDLAYVGAHIDDFRYCPHHVDATVETYRRDCAWRKPNPGMLLDLMGTWPVDRSRSLLVGDKRSDTEAAGAAGIRSVVFAGGDLRDVLVDADVLR